MSEYVVNRENVWPYGSQREEIVRCRDCSKWHPNDRNDDGTERGTCDEWTHLDGFSHATHEDGFCAWGERRNA